ncbi:hypothetical protein J8F10_15605 [Gemmata sp. G18]|uniref:PspA/IM30 family protein n=1 Tax=Gemmata palustris TaxID=2822762 RepID=A0ABS5BSR2_9BACT|nr:hypothetical protein [Gemmata palustris]MBP3956700.1 hypothetical protein [Gemmata palustris]
MLNLLTKIHDAARGRRANAEARYTAAVREAAEGKELDPDDVLELLLELDRGPEQFAADTQAIANRLELQAKLDTVPALKNEFAKYEKETADRIAAFKPIEKEYYERMRFLQFHRDRVEKQIREAEGAKQELYRSCRDPELLARASTIRGAIDDLAQQQQQWRKRIEDNRAALETATARNERTNTGLYAEDIANARFRLENATSKLAELNAQMARLVAAMEANDEAMRKV